MRRLGLTVVGVLLILLGLLWWGQGLGWLGGSPMTGASVWSFVGALVTALGLALVIVAWQRSSRR